ncbi:MAG: zf-HC2 domain-containing protein [Dehalococcoidia bacterium]
MNCKQVEPLLSDLLDAELSDDARDAVLAHLAACQSCGGEYRRLKRTVRFVRANARTPIRSGTPGELHADFERATMDDTFGVDPIDVYLKGARRAAKGD